MLHALKRTSQLNFLDHNDQGYQGVCVTMFTLSTSQTRNNLTNMITLTSPYSATNLGRFVDGFYYGTATI